MNILLVSASVPLPGEAGSPRTYHLAETIAAHHRIGLLLVNDQPGAPKEAGEYLFEGSPFDGATVLSVRPECASLLSKIVNALLGDPWFVTRIKRRAEHRMVLRTVRSLSQDADVVWVDGLWELQYAEGSRVPIVCDEVDYMSRLKFAQARNRASMSRRALEYGRAWLFRRYERRHLSRVERVTLISSLEAEAMFRDIGIRASVVTNGCDTDYFRVSKDEASLPGNPAITFVGDFRYPPNLDAARYMVGELSSRVVESFPAATLYLVGPPPDGGFGDVPPCVVVAGFVDDVRDYYTGADVFICPLRTGAGIKNKMLEAAAMECAIVASDVAAEGIAFEDRTHFLRATTTDEYVKGIAELIAGNGAYGRMLGRNAREAVVHNHCWRSEAEKMESLLVSAATRRELGGGSE